MLPDYNFNFKPGNNCIDFELNVNNEEELLKTKLSMDQAKAFRDALTHALNKAEEIHQIITDLDGVDTIKVTL